MHLVAPHLYIPQSSRDLLFPLFIAQRSYPAYPYHGPVTVCAIYNKRPVAIIVLRPSLCPDYSFPLFPRPPSRKSRPSASPTLPQHRSPTPTQNIATRARPLPYHSTDHRPRPRTSRHERVPCITTAQITDPDPELRILAMGTSGTNTRGAFAALFQPTHPNVAWAIRQSTTAYPPDYSITTAYELLSQQVPDFTRSVEAGLS